MPEDSSSFVARCPNCLEQIWSDHPYSWCSKCGERLPDDIQAQLPRLRELSAKASAARASLQEQGDGVFLADEAERIAQLYRRLVLLVGLQILLSFLRLTELAQSPILSVLLVLAALVSLGVLVATIVTTYKLASHLRAGIPVLWAIAVILPCINIIVLLALSSQAQAWCRRHGVKVGLLGPTKESIEELRRRVVSSTFE